MSSMHDGHHGSHGGHEGHSMEIAAATEAPMSTHMMGANSHQQMPHGMAMAMYFHFGYEQTVLFQQWTALSPHAMVITCVVYFLLAILYELVKAYRRLVAVGSASRSRLGRNSGRSMSTVPGSVSGQTRVAAAGLHGDDAHPAEGGNGSAASSLSGGSSHNGHQKLVPEQCGGGGGGHIGGNSRHQHHLTYVMDPAVPPPDDPSGVQTVITGHHSSTYGLQQQQHLHSSAATGVEIVGTSAKPSSVRLFATGGEMCSTVHLWSTVLYGFQVLLAYLLMLAFMLFNVWLCAAILFGAAVGHFVIAHKTLALQDHGHEDYCH